MFEEQRNSDMVYVRENEFLYLYTPYIYRRPSGCARARVYKIEIFVRKHVSILSLITSFPLSSCVKKRKKSFRKHAVLSVARSTLIVPYPILYIDVSKPSKMPFAGNELRSYRHIYYTARAVVRRIRNPNPYEARRSIIIVYTYYAFTSLNFALDKKTDTGMFLRGAKRAQFSSLARRRPSRSHSSSVPQRPIRFNSTTNNYSRQ